MNPNSESMISLSTVLLFILIPIVGVGAVLLIRRLRRLWRTADDSTRARWSGTIC
ncbi:MAG: hypothetical protein U0670_15325 [Anaerolineae bacterium]